MKKIPLLLFVILCACSCQTDLVHKVDKAVVDLAKDYFLLSAPQLSLPLIPNELTKADNTTNSIVVDWDNVELGEYEGQEIMCFPRRVYPTIIADIAGGEPGKIKHRCSCYQPYLVLKSCFDGSFDGVVVTMIKDAFSRSTIFIGDDRFTDFLIVSSLDGKVQEYLVRDNSVVSTIAPVERNLKNWSADPRTVIKGFKVGMHLETKGGGGYEGGETNWSGVITCSNCNRQYNALIWDGVCYYCGYDVYLSSDFCQDCHLPKESCVCGTEELCEECRRIKSLCTCDNGGDGKTGENVCEYCGRSLLICDTHCQDTCSICGKVRLYCSGHE